MTTFTDYNEVIADAIDHGMNETSAVFLAQGLASRELGAYEGYNSEGRKYGLIPSKEDAIDQAVQRVREALEHQNGSEVAETRLEKATEWLHEQEAQMSYLETTFRMKKAAYREVFGKEWVPYSPASKDQAAKNKQTASRLEAEEMLKKYQK